VVQNHLVAAQLREFLDVPGVHERSVLRSRFGFLALHGGLEAQTAEIALGAAAASESSVYAVVQPADLRRHVPSRDYDPQHSEDLACFLTHVDVVVSVHGYGGLRGSDDRWTTVLVGGRNRELASDLAGVLDVTLPHFHFVTDLERMPPELRGVHPENPVNRASGGGVQLELPPRIRGHGDAPVLVEALAWFARSAVEERQQV
jgi:phage replication-related protein YjqB (UPF0714/DUF867 family)